MSPVEIITIEPGLLLNLFSTTVTETLAVVEPSAPIAISSSVVIVIAGLLLLAILARIGWVLLHPQRPIVVAEGGAAH